MVRFVAEVSSNHNRDIDRCYEFIRVAARMGCSAVKFQLFLLDQLFSSEALRAKPALLARRQWELPREFLPLLSIECRQNNIGFSCTPFYLEAVTELEPYVDFYKIASYELLWSDLLRECAATGKPVVLSVGMANWSEIDQAVETVYKTGNSNLTLLHCVSGYPTPIDQCNLAVMSELRSRYNCAVGWSDHSVNAAVIDRAVNHWRAEMIEFHLDLDKVGAEYNAGHCWLPDDMGMVMRTLQEGIKADGDSNKPIAAVEANDRLWRADPSDGLRPLVEMRRELI